MAARIIDCLKKHPVPGYFLFAYFLSWSVELLLVANFNGWVKVPGWLHYLASFGPGLAGVFMTYLVAGRPGLVDLWSRITRWRVGTKWLILGLGSPFMLVALAVPLTYLFNGTWPNLGTFGQVEYLGDIGPALAFLLWLVTFGIGEEIGWRGFALPNLQKHHGFLNSTLLIGAVWAAWHIPSFFYKPQFMDLGLGGFFGFSLGVISGSIVLGWLYNRAGESILIVAIWHALFDFFTTSEAFKGTTTAILSTLVMVLAIAIVLVELQNWRPQWHLVHKPGISFNGFKSF